MVNGILIAFLISLIGTINLNFEQLKTPIIYLKGWIDNLKWGVIVALVLSYIAMPPLVFPDILVPIFITLGINCVVTLYWMIFSPDKYSKNNKDNNNSQTNVFVINKKTLMRTKLPLLILIFILCLWILTPLYSIVRAQELNQIPQVQISQEKISSIDREHIRQVPLEFAIWKADKVVGELGNRVNVGELAVQLYKGKLVWVAPLEFSNPFKWLQFRTSPGYIIVDAEKPELSAERIDNKKLKYIESAYLQNNVYRKVYQKYPFYRLQEFSFEIDEEGNAWWVVSATRPTVWNTGEKVKGAILLNAETGEVTFYDLDNVPKWADIVFSEKLAEDYNFWYGAYKHGYLNTLFTQKDMHIPTPYGFSGSDVFAVKVNNSLVWFTGHTSPSSQDQSMVGYSTIDTRTGEFTFYSNVSGYYNEVAAISNANSKVSNFEGYHGAQPVFYNLYGELTWVVPILSNNNQLQKIALVHASTGEVVLGDTLEQALDGYKKWITNNVGNIDTSDSNLETVDGVISRIGGNYILLENNKQLFTLEFTSSANDSGNVEFELSQKGDHVRIAHMNGEVKQFDNLELGLSE